MTSQRKAVPVVGFACGCEWQAPNASISAVRDLIRSMTRDVSRLESEMMPPETAESHEDAMGRLTQQARSPGLHPPMPQHHDMASTRAGAPTMNPLLMAL